MRFPFLGLGHLLGSAAAPYRHPGMVAVENPLQSRGGRRSRFLAQSSISHNCGGAPDRNDQLTRLEAVFFLSQQPLSSRKLAQLAGLADGTKTRTLVRTLNRRYDAVGTAFRVEEVAGGFLLMTRAKFAPWLRRLHAAQVEVRLSAPVLETLAVVAYRQPVLRAEIEAIRGVQSGEVLRQLIERDLVRIVGRSGELGRPFLYGTTKIFLQVFGLRHLDELPRADDLQSRTRCQTPDPVQTDSDTNTSNFDNHSPVAEEETIVKSLITVMPRQNTLAEDHCATAIRHSHDDRFGNQGGVYVKNCEEETRCFAAVDDDDDDDFEDEEEDEDEEEEEDLDDEPWEEVDDEDFDEEDDDWDEDEDWDDEDEDWDDDDDEWDDDDDEEEEEEEEEV